MTRFLLGQLSDEERKVVEDRFLTDDEYFAQLLVMEDSLVDDYVLGRLTGDQLKNAELLFRSSAIGKREVKFTQNLVASLKKGDRNVTGVSDMTPVKQQIELLLKVKKVKRLGHIYTSSEENAVVLAGIVKQACKELGIEFVETTVSKSSEVKQAVQAIIRRVDALYISTDNTVVSAMSAVSEVAMKAKVPIMSADPSSAENYPVLAAWGFDYYKMGRTTGKLVAEILNGKKPEQFPTRFMTKTSDVDLLINLDVAKKLGLTFPKDIVKSANKVVENGKLVKK